MLDKIVLFSIVIEVSIHTWVQTSNSWCQTLIHYKTLLSDFILEWMFHLENIESNDGLIPPRTAAMKVLVFILQLSKTSNNKIIIHR